MGQWAMVWSDDERAAIEYAWCDLNIHPRAQIVRMANAGELRSQAGGDFVPAFEIPYSSARSIGIAAEQRRIGKNVPDRLLNKHPRDRAHELLNRLSGIVDCELERLEKRQRSHKPASGEEIRQLARAMREIAAVPDPREIRLPRAPGQRETDGTHSPDGATSGGLAAKAVLVAAAKIPAGRANPQTTSPGVPAPPTTGNQHEQDKDGDNETTATQRQQPEPQDQDQHEDRPDDEVPGSSRGVEDQGSAYVLSA